ncbi:hypothetical protein MMC12_003740 [Toensbergia leucococca]|nr:hypothetical protein [Toensbergia leucococca]
MASEKGKKARRCSLLKPIENAQVMQEISASGSAYSSWNFPTLDQICRDVQELLNVALNADTAADYEKVLLSI